MGAIAHEEEIRMKGNRGWGRVGLATGTFAIGAAAGSVLALLFAPASGRAIRKRIGHQFKQTQKLLAKKTGVLREAALDKLGETREWLQERVLAHSNGNGKRSLRRRALHHA